MCGFGLAYRFGCSTAVSLVFGAAMASSVMAALSQPIYSDHGEALSATEPLNPVAADTVLPEAYLRDPLRLSAGVIDSWLQDPKVILGSYPSGGPAMVSYVRLLAGSDARSIVALIDVSKDATATTLQIEAIARGLAGASQRGQVIAPDYVAYIQRLVAESGSVVLIEAFAKALSEPETSELGTGAAAAGGAAVSSGTLTGTGNVGPSGSVGAVSTVATSSGSFSVSGGSVSGTGDGAVVPLDVSP